MEGCTSQASKKWRYSQRNRCFRIKAKNKTIQEKLDATSKPNGNKNTQENAIVQIQKKREMS